MTPQPIIPIFIFYYKLQGCLRFRRVLAQFEPTEEFVLILTEIRFAGGLSESRLLDA